MVDGSNVRAAIGRGHRIPAGHLPARSTIRGRHRDRTCVGFRLPPVSNRAHFLSGSLPCPRWDSNPHVRRSGRRASCQLGYLDIRADTGPRTRDLHRGRVALCLLSYIRMEPPAGLEPAPSPVPGARSGRWSYEGIAGRAGVEPASLILIQSQAATADMATGHRCWSPLQVSNLPPAPDKGAALPDELSGRAWCARPDSDRQPPGSRPGASASWATGTWSRRPVPTRAARCTKAGPQPCAAARASGAGLEPACP